MYLNRNGYLINKDDINIEILKQIKKELEVTPLVDNTVFTTKPVSYNCYIETEKKIIVPKMYGINKFKYPQEIDTQEFLGETWNDKIIFNGSLLPRQILPVDNLINSLDTNKSGILCAGTGMGKTISLLYVLSKLQGKTIVIVNKVSLMTQWVDEINKFLPLAKVATLQGRKISNNLNKCDIVVAMLQSLSMINYDKVLFQQFKVCVVDEAHNVSTQVFCKALWKTCCYYSIGLTATPVRSDGCEKVFKWHLGEIAYQDKVVERKGLPVHIILYKTSSQEYKEIIHINNFTQKKTIQFTSMLSELVNMQARNKLIIKIILDTLASDTNRKILVLTDRRNHVFNLNNMLKQCSYTCGVFIGGMKSEDLETSKSCQIILATYKAFGEGISEKDLDTLILTTPKKYIGHLQSSGKSESGKLEQIVGRIFRKNHTERSPIIYDIQDNFSVYRNQAAQRRIFYKKHFANAITKSINIDLDTDEISGTQSLTEVSPEEYLFDE